MFAAFQPHRPMLRSRVGGLCHHRNFIAIAIMQLAVAEVVAFTQRRQVLVTQHPLGAGGKDRLKARLRMIAMIAEELMPEWKIVANQVGK